MFVRLCRKFAQEIDGIDLAGYEIGDVLDLPEPQALVLIAEGWGEAEHPHHSRVLAFRRPAATGLRHGDGESQAS